MNTPERTEVVILDDSEQVRQEIADTARRIFPELNVNESGDAEEVIGIMGESAAKILILISDSQIKDSIKTQLTEEVGKTSLSMLGGIDVVQAAKRAGIPHVAYYSINSAWAGEIMCGDGVICITKPPNNYGIDKRQHTALENWLEGIRAVISSEIQTH